MVPVVEARKLSFPLNPSPSRPNSLIFDPDSLSLALMLTDSSIALFSPFYVSSYDPYSPPQTLIPSPSSSACFVRFDPNPADSSPNPKPSPASVPLFVAAGPALDGSRVLIRFLVRSKETAGYVRARVSCGQKGLEYDRKLGGVLVDCSHESEVLLAGSVNYFAMYSASAAKVWVFGVKSMVEHRGDVNLQLVKCAVIDCQATVSSITISSGVLIMGEVNGVRIFPLRPLVKGGLVGRRKKLSLRMASKENEGLGGVREEGVKGENRNLKLRNGFVKGQEGGYDHGKNGLDQLKVKALGPVGGYKNAVGTPRLVRNGGSVASSDGTRMSSVKLKSQRLSQESCKWGACFVPFNGKADGSVSTQSPHSTKTAISVHSFSLSKFLVVDSDGGAHVLCASISSPSTLKQLTDIIKVKEIAVLPEPSDGSRTVWLSDGCNSMHVMEVSDADTSSGEEKSDCEDMRLSVIQSIFTSEGIQDIKPLSKIAVLILGQDNMYVYAIS